MYFVGLHALPMKGGKWATRARCNYMINQENKYMTHNNEIIEKIKKVLAMTDSPYPEESQAAMLKAQELMIKNGLSISDIEDAGKPKQKEVVDEIAHESRRIIWWKITLSSIIGNNFRCHPYCGYCGVFFIGIKEDVEIAKNVYAYAVIVIEQLSKEYAKANKIPGVDSRRIKNTYIFGFLDGLRDRFAEQVNSECFALILVKDDAVIEAVENKDLSKGRKRKVFVYRDQNAAAVGYRDGKSFNPNKKMIQ